MGNQKAYFSIIVLNDNKSLTKFFQATCIPHNFWKFVNERCKLISCWLLFVVLRTRQLSTFYSWQIDLRIEDFWN